MATGSNSIQHNAIQLCIYRLGVWMHGKQDRLPYYLMLSSLELDCAKLAACHAGAQKQKKRGACLLAEAPSLLLPARLMHLETIGNSQSVYIFTHQLVTKLT